MKRMTLTTQITINDEPNEKYLYDYLDANGFGKYAMIARNTGGFEKEDQAEGIVLKVTCHIEDISANTVASQEP